MYNTSVIIRSLIGPGHGRVRVFATCIDVMAQLMFEHHIPMDDISVTKDVYPQVAEMFGMKPRAVSRNAERMANLCWSVSSPQRLEEVIGCPLNELPPFPPPKAILQFLAFYTYLETPFYTAIDEHPEVLF